MVLYIDIYFLTNWIFDGVLLLMSGAMTHRKMRFLRIGLAAAAGAALAVLCEVCCRGKLARTICGILLPPAVMTGIAFPTKKSGEYLYELIHLNLAAMVMGGMLHFLYENTGFGRFYRLWLEGTEWEGAAIWMLAVALAGCLLLLEGIASYRKLCRIRESICEVTLTCEERQVSVMALWDSGNRLYDSLYGCPVPLISYDICQKLLPEKEAAAMGRLLFGKDAKQFQNSGEEDTFFRGLHWIPFCTVGNGAGVLPVIRIPSMRIAGKGRGSSAWVGICKDGLSEQGAYQMLLPVDLEQNKRIKTITRRK